MSPVSLSSFLDAGVHGGRAGLRLEPRPRVATAEEGRGAAQADRGVAKKSKRRDDVDGRGGVAFRHSPPHAPLPCPSSGRFDWTLRSQQTPNCIFDGAHSHGWPPQNPHLHRPFGHGIEDGLAAADMQSGGDRKTQPTRHNTPISLSIPCVGSVGYPVLFFLPQLSKSVADDFTRLPATGDKFESDIGQWNHPPRSICSG